MRGQKIPVAAKYTLLVRPQQQVLRAVLNSYKKERLTEAPR